MQYRDMGKTGDRLSVLGYGCMRFPQKNGRVDEDRARRQILQAIDRGVNYFDTAYIYHGGQSESVLGRALAGGPREKVRIATKLPPYLVFRTQDMGNILETQLRRLGTDHIDYYLIHALSDVGGWQRLKGLGVEKFLADARAAGKIGHIGFSFHGDKEGFRAIVDDFPWEFCQIQYNYLDEHNQAGREGLQYAAGRGLGVVVMEPLRGGSLVGRVPREVQAVWDTAPRKRSPADWAFRWLWDQPEVTVVLSGLNEEAHIDENAEIASAALPGGLSAEELALYDRVKAEYNRLMKVSCTGCGYCMPCPAGVDIPTCFQYYNGKHLFKMKNAGFQYMGLLGGVSGGKPSYASLCKGCGRCEQRCPQHIQIRSKLKEMSADMENPLVKAAIGAARGYISLRDRLGGRGKADGPK